MLLIAENLVYTGGSGPSDELDDDFDERPSFSSIDSSGIDFPIDSSVQTTPDDQETHPSHVMQDSAGTLHELMQFEWIVPSPSPPPESPDLDLSKQPNLQSFETRRTASSPTRDQDDYRIPIWLWLFLFAAGMVGLIIAFQITR